MIEQVGARNLTLYRIVSGIVLKNNKILIVKNKNDDKYLWSLPGGLVEQGETLQEAIYRELNEEVGLIVNHLEIAYVHESFIESYSAHSLVTAFEVKTTNTVTSIRDPDGEVVGVKWIDVGSIDEYITNSFVLLPLKEWLKHKQTCKYHFTRNLLWD